MSTIQPEPRLIVLDTNTVMALWFFEDPGLFPLRQAISQQQLRLAARTDSLDELRRVLAYRQFAITPERQVELWQDYQQRIAVWADATSHADELPSCRDPDDQKFLQITAASGAQALLTRDKLVLKLARHRLIRTRFQIVTPEAFQASLSPPPEARAYP
jgi:putative PIN family toxin of toxin-antitoxin system